MEITLFRDPEAGERRNARRAECELEVTVRQRGCFAIPAHVVDLTIAGCRIVGGGPYAHGSEVWVRLPGLESQTARVIWSDGTTSGGAFERPLHPAVAARLLPAASRLALVAGNDASDSGPLTRDKPRATPECGARSTATARVPKLGA
ncbi:MAG TPA: PilZ domain-containing protein [Novosphingobium sp.]|nr:PilZ domain-containing protein [Novosphingobium sp.]